MNPSNNSDRKLSAVLFADIEGFTSNLQKDENQTHNWVNRFKESFQSLTKQFQGKVVQFYGDGCLCIFDSSVDAVNCAIILQKSFNSTPKIPVRIGIHSGDIIVQEDGVFGDSVNIASRVETIGIPGSIIITNRIFTDIKNKNEFVCKPLGKYQFKNVEERIELFAIDTEGLVVPKGKLYSKQNGNSNSLSRILLSVGVLLMLLIAYSLIKSNKIDKNENQESLIGIWNFKNKTGLEDFDLMEEMVVDRIIHGITYNELAKVVRGDEVLKYSKTAMSSIVPFSELLSFNEDLIVQEVISGNFYIDNDNLVFDCVIEDVQTKKVVKGIESVSCSKLNPMDCIEELRQKIMGFIATRKSRTLNELRETSIPKYDAFKQFSLGKNIEGRERKNIEKAIYHFNRAIEIDPNYFEPRVWQVSKYITLGNFLKADSLINTINESFLDVDLRQKNLLNFYDAWLAGQQDLAYKYFSAECELSPYDIATNTSAIVMALQFVNNLEDAFRLYNQISESDIDYTKPNAGRTRLYLKLYMDLKSGDLETASQTSKLLIESGALTEGVLNLIIKLYVSQSDWEILDSFLEKQSVGKYIDGRLYLTTAKELSLLGKSAETKKYVAAAFTKHHETLTTTIEGQLHFLNMDIDNATLSFEESINAENTPKRNIDLSKSYLAGIYLRNENQDKAKSLIKYFLNQNKQYAFGSPEYHLARAYLIGNDQDKALELLKKSLSQGHRFHFYSFDNDFMFLSIKNRPEFKKLLDYWND